MRRAALLAAATAFLAASATAGEVPAVDLLPVPTVTVYPGNTLTAALLADMPHPPGTAASGALAASRQAVLGKVARRTLLAGRPIPMNAIADPDLVNRGAITRAVFAAGGVTITAKVVALQSGPLGAAVQVRNVDSGQVVIGSVEADGTVRIGP